MTTAASSYSRRIGSAEWLYLAIDVPNVVQHVFEGAGTLDPETLAAAVATVAEACPGTRLRRRGRRWIDSGVAPATRLVRLEPRQELLAHPALQTTLNDGGPTCEVLLVTGGGAPAADGSEGDSGSTESTDSPDRTESAESTQRLVFRGFHGVTDARGVLLWAADVFRVLRGEQPLGASSRLNSDEFLKELLPDGLPPIARGQGELAWPSSMAPITPGRHDLIWRRRTVEGTQSAVAAKVIAALATHAADATHATQTDTAGPESAGKAAPDSGRFFVPVDLRRHQPGLRSTVFLSLALQLDVAPGTGWEEIHRELLTGLAERQEITYRTPTWIGRLPLPLVRVITGLMGKDSARKQRYLGTAYVTNLGFTDPAEYRAEAFRTTTVYNLGGSGPSSPPGVDVTELPGRTEIVLTWQDVPGAAERMDALLDVIVEALSPRADRDPAANRTDRAPATDRSLLRLFRDQVESRPDAIALDGPEGEVTYRELSERADVIAAELRARGTGRGDVVGLLAERTTAAIAGIWGVLRVGACYLALDVQHPDRRLADLLSDSGARHCLVQAPHDARGCFPEGCEPISLDKLMAADASRQDSDATPQSSDPLPHDPGSSQAAAVCQEADPQPEDLAYLLYTSGSTGRPKGVQIEHGSLLNYLHWAAEEFGADAATRLPLLTSLSFDVSGTSIFLPLIAGGTVVLVRDQPTHLTLRRLLEDSGATMLNLTPSHLELIGRLDIAPRGFRSIVVVGEQLRVEVAARAQEMFGPDCRIINEYGPTEATIGCTAHTFDPVRDAGGVAVPIGVPAHNTRVHLLDANRRFVAAGETGEMYLAGVQLARGYLGRPDLDAERFPRLADGTRVYRTGDLARRRSDGGLEFLGRIDDQVKVRGHRVEPAEVATTLEEHPRVDRAVVVARTRPDGTGKALYGYVLVNGDVRMAEVQAHVAERLPAYMVPAATIVVDQIPYSVAGKVDVRSLPDPFADRMEASEKGQAAGPAVGTAGDPEQCRDEVETRVGRIWSGVLRLDEHRIDPYTDFHQLGGDSVSLLTMLAGVCRDVVPTRETEFMAQLARVIAAPTVTTVAAIAREVSELDHVG